MKVLRTHKGSGLLVSLLITAILVVMMVLFFLKNQTRLSSSSFTKSVQAGQSSVEEAGSPVFQTPQSQIPLGATRKAIDDANRKILEDSQAIENLQ